MQFGLKNKQNHCEMIYYINCPNNHKHKHLYLKYICICIGQVLDKHRFHRGGTKISRQKHCKSMPSMLSHRKHR